MEFDSISYLNGVFRTLICDGTFLRKQLPSLSISLKKAPLEIFDRVINIQLHHV